MSGEVRVNPGRIFCLKEGEMQRGPVVYWMQRDQRVHDNWALLYAFELAQKEELPLYVVFTLVPVFNHASYRHYSFMLAGLREADEELAKLNITFVLLYGNPENEIPVFLKNISAGVLVTDFNPIKPVTGWKEEVKGKIGIPFYEVDAHNIVPCRKASGKLEFGAYTLRPKINKLLTEYLEEFPALSKMKVKPDIIRNNWDGIIERISEGKEGVPLESPVPGEQGAIAALQMFADNKFARYNIDRNHPSLGGTSNLSPYFHFGHLAPQRAALTVQRLTDFPEAQAAFLEELIIRRELADNFCFYNPDYDNTGGFHAWAKESLNLHRKDKREYLYSVNEFEKGKTHEPLWNAAQSEMVLTGKMHGYMRMYWAKKILEWTASPEEAMKTAIYLNDKYELDGRDPSGYAGIAWSIGGVHDRAWGERSVFGKIRYMNYNGCKRKFDVDLYIEKIKALDGNI